MLEKQSCGLFVDVSQLALSSFANNLFHYEAKKWCQIYCTVYKILCIILYVVGKINLFSVYKTSIQPITVCELC